MKLSLVLSLLLILFAGGVWSEDKCEDTWASWWGTWTDCIGSKKYSNGDSYTGSWKDNKPHGKIGAYRFKNGDLYTGSFKNGKRHGMGSISYKEKDYSFLRGEWIDGKLNGRAVFVGLGAHRSYEVIFANGRQVVGTLKYYPSRAELNSNRLQNAEAQKKKNQSNFLIGLGKMLMDGQDKSKSGTAKSSIGRQSNYSSTLTVPSNQNCPLLTSRLAKQEVIRGNRICYYQ